MVYIVYATTTLSTNQVYIGVHGQPTPIEFDGYLGSGDWKGKKRYNKGKQSLREAIKFYGKDSFRRDTLHFYDVEKEAYAMEALIVDKDFIKENWNYNLTPGGKRPPSGLGTAGPNHPNRGRKDKPETTLARRMAKLGKKRPEWSIKAKELGVRPPSCAGKIWINDGKKDAYIPKTDTIPYGWSRGRIAIKGKRQSELHVQRRVLSRLLTLEGKKNVGA
jgi:hypothetical protein